MSIQSAVHLTWATGFLVSRLEELPTGFEIRVWEADAGRGTPLLWATNDHVAWVYFGSQPPPEFENSAAATRWIQRVLADPRTADELSDAFALLAIDRRTGRLVVAGDRLGVQPIYYTPGGAGVSHISTHLTWLLIATDHDGSVDDESFLSHFAFGYAVSDTQTPYKNVLRLVPAGCLISESGRRAVQRYCEQPGPCPEPRIPELIAVLQESMQSRLLALPLFLPVTAGKDSLCLASVLPGDVPTVAGTFGAPQSADRLQGKKLGAALGVPHRAAGLCTARSAEEWMSYVALHSGGLATASYVDMARFVGEIAPPHGAVVLGEGGECVREFFRTEDGPLSALTQSYMTPADFLGRTLAKRYSARLHGYPAELLASVRERSPHEDDEAFAVDFYRSVRMPGNFSLRHSVLATLRPKLSPFLDRRFIEASYGLPMRWFQRSMLHRTIVETVRPGWLQFFDHPDAGGTGTQNWESRIRGQVGRQFARRLSVDLQYCDDVFDVAGVNDLMGRTVARPDRAVHHLLRLGSFAAARRMVRADGEELARRIGERTFIAAAGSAAYSPDHVVADEPASASVA